jgi:hypothetical protein
MASGGKVANWPIFVDQLLISHAVGKIFFFSVG